MNSYRQSIFFMYYRITFCFFLSLFNIPVLYCHGKKPKSFEKYLFIILTTYDLETNYPVAILDTVIPYQVNIMIILVMFGISSQILSASISLMRCIKIIFPFYHVNKRITICLVTVFILAGEIASVIVLLRYNFMSNYSVPDTLYLYNNAVSIALSVASNLASVYTHVYLYQYSEKAACSNTRQRFSDNQDTEVTEIKRFPDKNSDPVSEIIQNKSFVTSTFVRNKRTDFYKEPDITPETNSDVATGKQTTAQEMSTTSTKATKTVNNALGKPVGTLFLLNIPYIFQLISVIITTIQYLADEGSKTSICNYLCSLNFYFLPIFTSCFNPIVLLFRNHEFQHQLYNDMLRLVTFCRNAIVANERSFLQCT